MDVQRLNRIADLIESQIGSASLGVGFNMKHYFGQTTYATDRMGGHPCGTTACIAGWTVLEEHVSQSGASYAVQARGEWQSNRDVHEEAEQLLGLTRDQSYDLFTGCPPGQTLGTVRPEQAVKVIRHLADTGEVDWYVASDRYAPELDEVLL